MLHRMLLSTVVVCVVPGFALAIEKPSVDSPEAFKACCDEAMPDLLAGNVRAAEAFRKVAPEAKLASFGYEFRRQIERGDGERGEAIDWKYLGEKRLGSTLRQYLYVARYSVLPLIWRFTAVEEEGKWMLEGITWNSKTESLLSAAPTGEEDAACGKICSTIAWSLGQGKPETRELVRANFLKAGPQFMDRLDEVVVKVLAKAEQSRFLKAEHVASRLIGDVLCESSYLVQFDNGWFIARFELYRAQDPWRLKGMQIETDTSEVLERMAISTPSDSAVRTARATDGKTERK